MNILYVDYMSPAGHEVFNIIQLNNLQSIGCKIHLVVYGNFLRDHQEEENIKITRIPDIYRTKNKSSLSIRYNDLKRLLWVKRNINVSCYDYVIFSSYDILSLCFLCIKRSKIIIIDHNNVDQLDSKIKLFLTRHLPSHYVHVALNEYMEVELKELLPGKRIEYVPHGFLEPSDTMKRPPFIKESSKFVFCPVNRNYDAGLVDDFLNSSLLNAYLEENEITVYVKSQLISESKGNFKVIGMLTDDEYNYMLTEAMAVLLPYGDEFRYRCSGILFECVARKTPIIATEREALKIYKDKINICYFKDSKSFIDALNNTRAFQNTDFKTEEFLPAKYWKQVLI